MRNHERAFGNIKKYYNDITANNMALINALKVCLSVCHNSFSVNTHTQETERGRR